MLKRHKLTTLWFLSNLNCKRERKNAKLTPTLCTPLIGGIHIVLFELKQMGPNHGHLVPTLKKKSPWRLQLSFKKVRVRRPRKKVISFPPTKNNLSFKKITTLRTFFVETKNDNQKGELILQAYLNFIKPYE